MFCLVHLEQSNQLIHHANMEPCVPGMSTIHRNTKSSFNSEQLVAMDNVIWWPARSIGTQNLAITYRQRRLLANPESDMTCVLEKESVLPLVSFRYI